MAHEPLKMQPIELPFTVQDILAGGFDAFLQILTVSVSQMPPLVWGVLLFFVGLKMLRVVHAVRRLIRG